MNVMQCCNKFHGGKPENVLCPGLDSRSWSGQKWPVAKDCEQTGGVQDDPK